VDLLEDIKGLYIIAGAKGQGDACDDGLQLESVCELLHDMTTGAMQNHSAVASGGIDTRGGVGGAGASGVKTQDEDVCLEESGAHMTGQDGQMGERVRAMLAARARRGLLSSEGGARGVRGYPPEQAAKGLWRDGPFALDTGEEELPDIKARRATLSVGSWAGPRTLARREKMLASSRGKAMRDKRKADAEQVQAVLVKYKQLGVARSGWRVRSAVRDALTMPSGGGPARLPGAASGALEDASAEKQLYIVDGIPTEKSLWLSRVPVRLIVASKSAALARRKQLRVDYNNYFTRKNAMGKTRKASGVLNSGYRP